MLIICCAGMLSGAQERERTCTTKGKGSDFTTVEKMVNHFVDVRSDGNGEKGTS